MTLLQAKTPKLLVALAAVLLLGSLVACQPQSPAERIDELRAGYEVEVNPSGFSATPNYPEPPPMEEGEEGADEEMAADDEMAADEMAADEMGDGEMAGEGDMAQEQMEPESYDVVLDLLIKNGNRDDSLQELTVDLIHADSNQNERGRLQVVFDTSNVLPGASSQFSQELKGIPYEEGDMFTAEIRQVPAEERGDYPEYGSAN
ncbi:MAG: hypothetical protein SX243_09320 [Acidobacteriota bacterium]|nr:hypothetical protein [Acidobacteriota bacterium]